MIQQKTTKKIVRRGGATLAAVAVAGGAIIATTAPASAASTWDQLAQCESSGNWSINTGNGYYGGLQFSLSTWKAFGGTGLPSNASKAEQIRIATKVQASQGWGAWPACSAKLGLSGSPKGTSTADTSSSSSTTKSTSSSSSSSSSASKSTTTKSTKKSSGTVSSTSSSTQKVKSTKSSTATTSGKRAATSTATTYNIDVTDSGKDYTVQSGDTLFKIAQKLGVSDWRGLFVLNNDQLSNPDLIYVGQTLNVPSN